MRLELTSFEKALNSLRESWTEFGRMESNTFVRDSVVQRFEYTYELSYKMLKRFLVESEFSSQEINTMVFADIVRIGNQKGLLLNDLGKWYEYRRMRNETCHTYDEARANEVLSIVPDFISDASFLLDKLQDRNKYL
jgi:nucleotidyltransferase substrate binding protein (TIGR01987 family)